MIRSHVRAFRPEFVNKIVQPRIILEELLWRYSRRDVKKVVLASECLQDCKCKRGFACAGKALYEKRVCIALDKVHKLFWHAHWAIAICLLGARVWFCHVLSTTIIFFCYDSLIRVIVIDI